MRLHALFVLHGIPWGVDRGVEHNHVDLPANHTDFLPDSFFIGAA